MPKIIPIKDLKSTSDISEMPWCIVVIWIMVRYRLRCMITAWKSPPQESCQWDKLWSV